MLAVGIIIAVASILTMLCTFANYAVLSNILASCKSEEELLKKLLRK